jgi:hypothetical protein
MQRSKQIPKTVGRRERLGPLEGKSPPEVPAGCQRRAIQRCSEQAKASSLECRQDCKRGEFLYVSTRKVTCPGLHLPTQGPRPSTVGIPAGPSPPTTRALLEMTDLVAARGSAARALVPVRPPGHFRTLASLSFSSAQFYIKMYHT